MSTFAHKNKCMACGLHFTVFSWHEDWKDAEGNPIHCPECGESRTLRFGPEELPGEIFEYVPGNATVGGVKLT